MTETPGTVDIDQAPAAVATVSTSLHQASVATASATGGVQRRRPVRRHIGAAAAAEQAKAVLSAGRPDTDG